MEPFSFNLNQTADKGARYKRLLIILTVLFLLSSSAVYFLFFRKTDLNIWILIGWAIYFLLFIYFGFVGYNSKMFINGDDFALEYQFGFFTKVPDKIIWETITKVKLGFTHITFYKKTGKRKVLELGWLHYTQVKDIKNKISCLCTEKGLLVEVAEFHRE